MTYLLEYSLKQMREAHELLGTALANAEQLQHVPAPVVSSSDSPPMAVIPSSELDQLRAQLELAEATHSTVVEAYEAKQRELEAHDQRLRGLLYAANYWVNTYMRKGATQLVDAVRAIEHRDDVDYAGALQARVDQQSDTIGRLEADLKDAKEAHAALIKNYGDVVEERNAAVRELSRHGGPHL